MTIDSQLIEHSAIHAQQQLFAATTVAPGLLFVKDFFHTDLLTKIFNEISQDWPWQSETIEDGTAAYPNRLKINWLADTVVEETHCVFEQLTPNIKELFTGAYRFLGIAFWKDLPGYQIGAHVDNASIAWSIQIYLSSAPPNLATEFYTDDQTLQAKYHVNHGYAMDNTKQIRHAMPFAVPENHLRLSCHAIWGK